MADWVTNIVIALPAGFVLGLFYFGGLYWTLKQLTRIQRTTFLVFGSFLVRLGVTLFAFYWISQGDWKRLIICLLGLLLARYFLIHRLGPTKLN